MRMVLVGGVPGAGKTTALDRLAAEPGVRVLDPDRVRRSRVGRLPHRLSRPLVHLTHQALVWVAVLAGAGLVGLVLPGTAVLLVHDTATRRRRREALIRAAAGRGWRPRLVLLDVSRPDALAGQHRRQRVVPVGEFDRHWRRWERLREHTAVGCPVALVGRADAVPTLRRLARADAGVTALAPVA